VPAPRLQFARSGSEQVGYHVFGDGNVPVVLLHSLVTSFATNWEHPLMVRLWSLYSRFARVVDLDPRGCGVSDPLPGGQVPSLETWSDDVVSVMEAAGMARASIAASGDSVAAAVAVATRAPERVDRLVLMDGFAKGTASADHPYGPTAAFVDAAASFIGANWGDGSVMAMAAPDFADDPDLCARTEQATGTAATAAALYRASRDVDVRSLLPEVAAPTLVAVTTPDPDVIAQSRYLADHIPGARYLEVPGDRFFWGDERADEVFEFLSAGAWRAGERAVVTVLFTDIVGSTGRAAELGDARWRDVLDSVDAYVEATVARAGGRVVKGTGDGHLVEFAEAACAVDAALAVSDGVRKLGVAVRSGLHSGEVERRGHDVGGITVHIAARIMGLAEADEVLVSGAVRDVVGRPMAAVGRHSLKGLDGEWDVFRVERP
jgi:class 3 adenylate cyclase